MKLLIKKLRDYYSNYYRHQLGLPDWQEWVEYRLNEEEVERSKITRLERILGSFKDKKMLDVGCGTGGFLVEAKKSGAIVYGVEPEQEAIDICRIKDIKSVKLAKAENLPFPNNSFDLVYCYTVLEHVDDPAQAILEMIRVAKPGGKIYIQTPNYLSFYEGHYKVFWLPLFPKKLAKLYLRLRGRNPKFLKTINYLTPTSLRKYLNNLPVKVEFLRHDDLRTKGFFNWPLKIIYTVFRIDPQIELIIKKLE